MTDRARSVDWLTTIIDHRACDAYVLGRPGRLYHFVQQARENTWNVCAAVYDKEPGTVHHLLRLNVDTLTTVEQLLNTVTELYASKCIARLRSAVSYTPFSIEKQGKGTKNKDKFSKEKDTKE